MINRTTHALTQRTSLANMQRNLAEMSRLQAEASSGRRLNRPSDDPAGTADALTLRRERSATAQYSRNAQDGLAWLNLADSALSSTSALLRRARDLTVQGSNTATMNSEAREALASELDGIRQALLDQANTTYLGRNIFAGTSGEATAFDPDTYEFSGVSSASVERRISDTATVRVDLDGAAVYGTNTNDPDSAEYSVFRLIDDISEALRSGGDPRADIARIDTRLSNVLTMSATAGARTNQIESAMENSAFKADTLKDEIAGIENIDLAETIMELKLQEVAYQSSLAATARVLQPSLLDYLR